MKNIKNFWNIIDFHRKKEFSLLVALMILASISEVLSISALIPFISLVLIDSDPSVGGLNIIFNKIISIDQIENSKFYATIIFVFLAIFSGIIRTTLTIKQNKFCFGVGADLSSKIYRSSLLMDYEDRTNKNTNEELSGILTKVDILIGQYILPIVTIFSYSIISISIILALLFIDPILTSLVFFGLFGLYLSIYSYTRNKLNVISKILDTKSVGLVKIINEGHGSLRDIIIGGYQNVFIDSFQKENNIFRSAQAKVQIYGNVPKYLVETSALVLIAITTYLISNTNGEMENIFATMAAIVLGIQKLFPMAQNIYNGSTYVKGSSEVMRTTLDLICNAPNSLEIEEVLDDAKQTLTFKSSIEFKNVFFKYKFSNDYVLKNVNVKIKKGQKVAIVGSSGSGKSTFMDLLMGLLTPSSGKILVDGIELTPKNMSAWRSQIAHVPQEVYLIDGSVSENITFCVPSQKLSQAKVDIVAKQASIYDSIQSMKDGYSSQVGELGGKLSGGQRQRIGIARALYLERPIVFMDEATSALDAKTEKNIINAIGSQKTLTQFFITHRLSNLKYFEKTITINNGEVHIN